MRVDEAIYLLAGYGANIHPNNPVAEAVKMGIEALEELPSVRPEKKQVIYYGDGHAGGELGYDSAECPSCGYIYDEFDYVWGQPFCPHCGQALDWEGEKDGLDK